MAQTQTPSFADLFEKHSQQLASHPGQIIIGKVISIEEGYVIVNAGLKSEAVIPKSQFLNTEGELEVSVGDETELVLDAIEDGYGDTLLSREKAKRIEAWQQLEKDYKAGKIVNCYVSGRVRGGFSVELGLVKGFLPGSLVDVRPVRDTSFLEDKEIEVKIIKMDPKRNNVVVSRKAAMEAGSEEDRQALLAKLEEGQVIKGIIKNLTDYGAFVDLGGVDGLLHITDMSWKRIKHPSEIVNIGDEVSVVILKFDKDKNRVSLGLKQMGDDPWQDIKNRYPIGTRLSGVVSNITDYGAFVEIETGIEGLVHVSEMDWTNKNANPYKTVQVGDEIEVMVLELDEQRRRISLGMKQTKANPWKDFSDKHQKGDKLNGTIRSITDFGIFIGLDGNIDGLVHLSDISWDKPSEEAIRDYKKGQEIETVILAIDAERERISLGIKQLEKNSMAEYVEAQGKSAKVTGKIVDVDEKRALVQLTDEIQGVIRAGDISRNKVKDVREIFDKDEEITAQIISIDNKNRLVNLSLKALESKTRSGGKTTEAPNTTLGDLFKEQLDNNDRDEAKTD
ncbi:MAG: 30S ribosomal protein S1 [Pseudomonadota bacterium]